MWCAFACFIISITNLFVSAVPDDCSDSAIIDAFVVTYCVSDENSHSHHKQSIVITICRPNDSAEPTTFCNADVLAVLRGAAPAPLPEGLAERLQSAVEGAVADPFAELADSVYTYLVALLDQDTLHAEQLVVEVFVRAAGKEDPTLASLLQVARHAALEAVAKAPLKAKTATVETKVRAPR